MGILICYILYIGKRRLISIIMMINVYQLVIYRQ